MLLFSSSVFHKDNAFNTHDGRTGQDLAWNVLNLIPGVSKTVSGTNTQLASYTLFADGSKYSAVRADGTGYTVFHHITDHLGSVRAITNASTGNVVETSDFLPFGTRWSQTSGSSSSTLTDASNRWRYSGKEEQKTLNSSLPLIDYGARMYDPTIARWLSVDPMAEKYYPLSPYVYCANNSVSIVDYHGDSLWVKNNRNEYQYNNGSFYLNGQKVKEKGFLKSVGRALESILNTEEGASMIQELSSSNNTFTIVRGDEDKFQASNIINAYGMERIVRFDPYVESKSIESVLGGSGGIIVWNPNGVLLPTTQGLTKTPFADLAHEMFHALDANRGSLTDEKTFSIKNNEWQAVYRENTLRSQAGLPLRTHYQVAFTLICYSIVLLDLYFSTIMLSLISIVF